MDKSIFISGPDPILELVYTNVWLPGLYSRRILCFRLPQDSSHAKAVEAMEKALKALVEGTPELGGQSVVVPAAEYDNKTPWRAIQPDKGIELVVKDLTSSFMSFYELEKAGYPLSAFTDELLMPVAGPIMPEPQPQAKFQMSLIGGGVLLSCYIYHHLTDGNGMNTIMRALGDLCKEAAQASTDLAPRVLDTDRSLLLNLKGMKTDLADHPAYSIAPGVWTPGVSHDEPEPHADSKSTHEPTPPPEFAPGFFRLEHAKAELLKAAGSTIIPVSTHDAISALLWRTLVLARHQAGKLDADAVSNFTVPHNARKHLGLPKEWIGNCVYFISASIPVSKILKADSLPFIAAKIRTALNKVDKDVVEGLMQLRRQDPYSLSWWPVMEAIDKHVVAITSMYHSELLEMDWGAAFGEVRHFTSTEVGALGASVRAGHFPGPKLAGGRGCDVHAGLLKDEAVYFAEDELWGRYFGSVVKSDDASKFARADE